MITHNSKKRLLVVAFMVLPIAFVLVFLRKYTSMPPQTTPSSVVRAVQYLPLGDSYTIGQSVPQADRWPDQLVARLKADGIDIAIAANPSVTGYTTQNLIERERPLLDDYKPNFVTVLIGVNDYVQDVPVATTTSNLKIILDKIQRTVSHDKIILVTIPDYSKTPSGAAFGDPAAATAAIEKLNGIILNEANHRNILAVDIFSISQQAAQDPTLTAGDGLHPSGKQYGLWADVIYKAITKQKILQAHTK